MLTALMGAIINVVLNFILIPSHGAMGAAVATLISYMTVYAVRVVDTRRYVSFNTHNIKLVINTLILAIQSIILLSGVRYSFFISLGLFCLVAIFNLGGIISTILRIVQKFLKKAKNN